MAGILTAVGARWAPYIFLYVGSGRSGIFSCGHGNRSARASGTTRLCQEDRLGVCSVVPRSQQLRRTAGSMQIRLRCVLVDRRSAAVLVYGKTNVENTGNWRIWPSVYEPYSSKKLCAMTLRRSSRAIYLKLDNLPKRRDCRQALSEIADVSLCNVRQFEAGKRRCENRVQSHELAAAWLQVPTLGQKQRRHRGRCASCWRTFSVYVAQRLLHSQWTLRRNLRNRCRV
jgi:hypothetical protein